MGIRILHRGVQKVSAREDDNFLFSSQQKECFLKKGSSDISVGNLLMYNGSKEDWSHARY
jgi:hypothetical protein